MSKPQVVRDELRRAASELTDPWKYADKRRNPSILSTSTFHDAPMLERDALIVKIRAILFDKIMIV